MLMSSKTDERAVAMATPPAVVVHAAGPRAESSEESDQQDSVVRSGERDHDQQQQQQQENTKPAAKEGKPEDSDNAKSKTSVSKAADVRLPSGVLAFIDSEVLAPREEQSSELQKPRSKSKKSNIDDANVGADGGIQAISSPSKVNKPRRPRRNKANIDDANVGADGIQVTPSTDSTPGAVRVQHGETYEKDISEPFTRHSNISEKSCSTASLAAPQHQEDPEAQAQTRGTLLVAVRVVESNTILVTAVATEDDGFNKARILVLGAGSCLVLMVALVVGLSVAFAGGGTEKENFFETIGGDPIDGTARNGMYGASVATDRDGSRIAVADLFGVHVYELLEDEDSNWEMLGSNIQGDTATENSTSGYLKSLIRAPILTTMSRD
jgi:hypothetical protein